MTEKEFDDAFFVVVQEEKARREIMEFERWYCQPCIGMDD